MVSSRCTNKRLRERMQHTTAQSFLVLGSNGNVPYDRIWMHQRSRKENPRKPKRPGIPKTAPKHKETK
eukprot:5633296-Amphidinium_carterae.1